MWLERMRNFKREGERRGLDEKVSWVERERINEWEWLRRRKRMQGVVSGNGNTG